MLAALGKGLTDALNRLNAGDVNEETVQAFLKAIVTALIEADVSIHLVKVVRDRIRARAAKMLDGSRKLARQHIKRSLTQFLVDELKALLSSSTPVWKPTKDAVNLVMFVGLQGVGKTTTVGKYAAYHKAKGFRVGVVCADTFRAGAYDQLKQNAARTKVSFYGDPSILDAVEIAVRGVQKMKKDGMNLIIVDTSGRHSQEDSLVREMKEINAAVQADACIYVVDAHIGQACFDQAKAFRENVNVASVIVTKLDANVKGGGALTAASATGCPIAFIGTGESFDQFEPFDVDLFVARLLNIHDLQSLSKMVSAEPMPEKDIKRWTKGDMTFEDLRKQLSMMNGAMSMMSGMLTEDMKAQTMKEWKIFAALIDSMTPAERNCEVSLEDSPSRRLRLARGAGCQLAYVDALLTLHRGMAKTFSKVGKKVAKAKRQGTLKKDVRRVR